MFKHFDFGIFLTTLGIVSMTHAISREFYEEMQKLANEKPYLRTDYHGPKFPVPPPNYASKAAPPAASKAPATATSNDLSQNQLSGNTKYTTDDSNAVDSGVLTNIGTPETKVTSIIRCWVDGQWVILRPGETCDGSIQVVNTENTLQYTPSLPQIPSTPVFPELTRSPSITPNYSKIPMFQKSMSLNSPWSTPNPNTSQLFSKPNLCFECSNNKEETELPLSSSPTSQIDETPSSSPSLSLSQPSLLTSPSPIRKITETISPPPSLLRLKTTPQRPRPWASGFRFDNMRTRFNDHGLLNKPSDSPKAKEESTSTPSTNTISHYLDTPIIREITITSPRGNYYGNYAPVKTPSLINNNMGNTTTTEPKSQSFLQPGSKEYTLPNGNVLQAELPKEIPVQYHSYERPLGLTQSEVDEIRNQVLAQNNYYRTKYGIKSLKPNKDMNNHAQEWANKSALSKKLSSRLSTENDFYGQNLYASQLINNIGKEAVDIWYNELRFVKVTDGEEELRDNPKTIGHMITLLWKGSREIGIGVAKSDNNVYFIVADYNPRGKIYPFLKDNLPEFQQSDIDEAKNAHAAIPGEVKVVNSSESLSPKGTVIITTRVLTDPNDYYKNAKEPKPYSYQEPLRMSKDEVELIRQDVFNKSNYYRKLYNMPELVLNTDIDHYSQEWANTLGAIEDKFDHRPDDGTRIYGENLHKSQDFLHVGEIAVDLWYSEIGLVHENNTEEELLNNRDAENLTQLLWRRSNQMGCGAARYPDGKVIVVANYNPTGNVQGLYLTNLPTFSQVKIEEGKRLRVLNEQIGKMDPVPPEGQKRRLSGWISYIYHDEPQGGVVSPNPQTTMVASSTPVTSQPATTNESDAYYRIHARNPQICDYQVPIRITTSEVVQIRTDVLNKSNEYRKKYGMPELVLNNDMNNYSQAWASALALTDDAFDHRPNGMQIYGENLHRSHDFLHVGEIAVDLWYYEIGSVHETDTEDDLYRNNEAKNLTQLLWRRSEQMGCGAAKYRDGKVIIVANYNPTGNVKRLYLENLPKFIKDQIDEGKRLLGFVQQNILLGTRPSLPTIGSKMRLPGWKSFLYNDPDLNPSGSSAQKGFSSIPILSQSNDPYNITMNEVNQIRKDVFDKCNFYRRKYSISELILKEEINNYAQEWANDLAKKSTYNYRPSATRKYGENLLNLPYVLHVGEFAVDIWYYGMSFLQEAETEDSIFRKIDTRHLTQLLWRTSTEMGIGVSKYLNKNIIIVADFNPSGNKRNNFLSNIPKFTQEQINEVKRLQQIIDDGKAKHRSLSQSQGLQAIPNWTSDLHTT